MPATPDAAIYDANSANAELAAVRAAARVPLAQGSHHWVERGPFGVTFIPGIANGGEKLSNVDGIGTALVVDPSDKTGNTAYFGTHGGLWVTHDGGKTIHNLTDGKLARTAVGAVAVDPAKPKNLYVGTGISLLTISDDATGAGIYVSHDAGRHFLRPAKNIKAYGVNAITVDGSVVLAATNAGLYRSTDNGGSWHRVFLPTSANHQAQAADPFGNWIQSIAVRPGHPNEVTVDNGFAEGRFIGPDGKPVSPGNGLYRSTDYGRTFHFLPQPNQAFSSRTNNPDITDDAVGRISLAYGTAPGQGSTLWALVSDAGKAAGKSTTDLPDFPDPLGIGLDPGKTTEFNGLYRSLDDGQTWTLQANSETLIPTLNSTQAGLAALDYAPGVQSSYNNWVLTDPTDPNRVYFGLEEAFEGEYGAVNPANVADPTNMPLHSKFQVMERYADTCGFYSDVANSEAGLVTGNGGSPSTPCPSQLPVYGGISTHPDQHSAAIIKTANGGERLYSGNDGGFYVQDENSELDSLLASGNVKGFGNGEWRQINHASTTLPYHADFWSNGRVLVALQDNGAAFVKPNGVGVEICGGDSMDVFPGPDPHSLICTHGDDFSDYVTAEGQHDFDASPDGGPDGTLEEPFGLAPMAQDPGNRTHLIAAGRDVQESLSLGSNDNWAEVYDAKVGPGKVVPGCPHALSATHCDWQASTTAIYGARAYVGMCSACRATLGDTSQVHSAVATNVKPGCTPKYGSSKCWHMMAGRGLPKRRISGIAFDPAHPSTVYVSLQDLTLIGYNHKINGVQRVMVSHDAGGHFTDVSGNLPLANTWSLVLRNGHPIVGSDVGVFTAAANSSHWFRLGTGLPQVKINSVRLDATGRRLVVAPFGRGAWVYDFSARARSGSNVAPRHRSSGAPGGSSASASGAKGQLAMTGTTPTLAGAGLVLILAGLLLRRLRTEGDR